MKDANHASHAAVASKMRQAFFDLDGDGVLVYQDPFIGRLANRSKLLVVKFNAEHQGLELRCDGQTLETFPLDADVVAACRQAFGAYFTTFQELCSAQTEAVMAA